MLPALFQPVKKASLVLSRIIIVTLLLFWATTAMAQKFSLKGTIVDEKGAPVINASVYIKGKTSGTTSGLSGKFHLQLASIPATIVCSSVGFESKNVVVQKWDFKDSVASIRVVLKNNTSTLDEVVVTSLGLVRQKNSMGYSTTSVGTIATGAGFEGVLSGKVSGLSVGSATSVAPRTSTPSKGDTHFVVADDKKTTLHDRAVAEEKRGGLLTAGELNDFKKWKMWEDYNKNEFKTFSEKWELFAENRYCVQLQNEDSKPVVNEKIYLLNKTTGDTLWNAISDNTGKAELWSGFNKKTKDENLVIAVEKEKKQFPAIPFMQGINKVVIKRSCTVSNKVEIAFVVDATGSMQDEINYLKDELEDVLTKITLKDPKIDLYTGAVFYRDKGDAYLTREQEFSNTVANTTGFINQQGAGGGGDYPEAVNDGLRSAIEKFKWSADARTRIIFLFMDAPPHDDAKNEMAALIIQAAAKGIRIVPVACSGTDKATEFIMRSIALATNGSYLFLTDDSGIGDSHIKPTTDEFKVELLNDLLQRIIEQMCFVNDCEHAAPGLEPVAGYKNPENVKIFPNPTTGPVTLETTKKLKEIFVADFTGKLLMRIVVNPKQGYRFDLSGFPSGTYFIKYITEENKTGTEKLVLLR